MAWAPISNLTGPKGDKGDPGATTPAGTLTYKAVEFFASGTFTPPQELLDAGGEAHVLLVGGGGGGGYGGLAATGESGGGGGGGEVLQAVYKFTGATTITVGDGGAGATTNAAQGTDGGDTSVGSLTAQGGGGGGSSVTAAARDGRSKGTGGGTGTSHTGQVNCGGGGGGGAGGHGESALLGTLDSGSLYHGVIGRGRNGGDGGAGIVATNVRSGGAGGMGVLGFGGGGAGGGGSNVTSWFSDAKGSGGGGDAPGGDAIANSGGGGAGGGNRGAKATGGNGAAGRVKIWWYEGARGTKGDAGDTGPANSLTIGTVIGGAYAGATITGAAPSQTLNLTLPKGDQGPKGDKGDPGSVGWADVTGKPTTFPPAAHTHAIADVTGLQTALDGKQAASSNLNAWSGKSAPSGAIVDTSSAQTLASKTLANPVINNYARFNGEFNAGNSGTTVTLNFANGQKQRLTLTDNATITLSFPGVGNYQVILVQDATGSRACTLSGVSYWVGAASQPSINTTANARTLVSLYWDGSAITCGVAKLNAT